MKFYLLLITVILSIFPAVVAAQDSFKKQTLKVPLGETVIKINVYEKAGASVTFFAPHHNEQIAVKSAKDAVEQKGGRLVEIESLDQNGNPARRLSFKFNGKFHMVDPNRIFTRNGRRCAGFSGEIEQAIQSFAAELLKIIFPDDASPLLSGERLLVAVHNNADVDDKTATQKSADLTAVGFLRNAQSERGAFEAQAAGVYFANAEADADNFIILSSTRYVGFFAENNFNVVVQKSAHQLESGQCALDDGSLSIYAGQQGIEYVCLEADAASGALRQKQMIAAVYRLLTEIFARENEQNVAQSASQK